MSKTNDIERLLDRFYAGETTDAEESRLWELLEQTTGEELEADRMIFDGMKRGVEIPDGLEERLSRAIDGWEETEKVANRRRRTPMMWLRAAGIAASVAILVGVGLTINRGSGGGTSKVVTAVSDPNEAYAATEKALTIFANALNKGLDGVELAEQVSDKVMSTIEIK